MNTQEKLVMPEEELNSPKSESEQSQKTSFLEIGGFRITADAVNDIQSPFLLTELASSDHHLLDVLIITFKVADPIQDNSKLVTIERETTDYTPTARSLMTGLTEIHLQPQPVGQTVFYTFPLMVDGKRQEEIAVEEVLSGFFGATGSLDDDLQLGRISRILLEILAKLEGRGYDIPHEAYTEVDADEVQTEPESVPKISWGEKARRFWNGPAAQPTTLPKRSKVLKEYFTVAEIRTICNKLLNIPELHKQTSINKLAVPSQALVSSEVPTVSKQGPNETVAMRWLLSGEPIRSDRMHWHHLLVPNENAAMSLDEHVMLQRQLSYYHINEQSPGVGHHKLTVFLEERGSATPYNKNYSKWKERPHLRDLYVVAPADLSECRLVVRAEPAVDDSIEYLIRTVYTVRTKQEMSIASLEQNLLRNKLIARENHTEVYPIAGDKRFEVILKDVFHADITPDAFNVEQKTVEICLLIPTFRRKPKFRRDSDFHLLKAHQTINIKRIELPSADGETKEYTFY